VTDYDFPKAPEIEEAWRVAHRSLEGIAPPGFGFAREKDLLVTEVISQFPQMVREAQIASAAQIGPLISWEGPPREKDWDLVISGIDLDGGDPDFGLVELSESAFEGPGGDWMEARCIVRPWPTGGNATGTSRRARRESGC
jgi:hypothetical protein